MSQHDNQDGVQDTAPPSEGSSANSDSTTQSNSNASQGDAWQQTVINRLAFAALKDQQRARIWSNIFKGVSLVYVGVFIYIWFVLGGSSAEAPGKNEKHVALVELHGVISATSVANADAVITSLRAAFKQKNSQAVILRINSPGGSPVQAAYIYDEIRRLRKKYPDKKLYAVATDVCASAAYYVAAAADKIYANRGSLVGSIGVLMNGFGFVKGMEKLGVERRLLTAGEHKGLLDPFSPLDKGEEKFVLTMLEDVHQQFIKAVVDGRGDRLKKDAPGIFSGLFWQGEKSVELGLVDALGSASFVAREVVGNEKIVDYTVRPNFLDRFADKVGAAMGREISTSVGLQGFNLQ